MYFSLEILFHHVRLEKFINYCSAGQNILLLLYVFIIFFCLFFFKRRRFLTPHFDSNVFT